MGCLGDAQELRLAQTRLLEILMLLKIFHSDLSNAQLCIVWAECCEQWGRFAAERKIKDRHGTAVYAIPAGPRICPTADVDFFPLI
eukprot:g51297.t1